MQINSIWLSTLQKAGITLENIQYNLCANILVGAWILSQNIATGSTLWKGVGNYHSHTKIHNQRYYTKVKDIYTLLNHYLDTRFFASKIQKILTESTYIHNH